MFTCLGGTNFTQGLFSSLKSANNLTVQPYGQRQLHTFIYFKLGGPDLQMAHIWSPTALRLELSYYYRAAVATARARIFGFGSVKKLPLYQQCVPDCRHPFCDKKHRPLYQRKILGWCFGATYQCMSY